MLRIDLQQMVMTILSLIARINGSAYWLRELECMDK